MLIFRKAIDRLTDLMIRFGVGVQIKETFHVVEVDEDFFQ